MTKRLNQKLRQRNHLYYDALEPKRCLTSVGWDGPGQGQADLTFYVGPVPEGVDQETFEEVVNEAVQAWAEVTAVTFTQTDTPGQVRSIDFTFAEIDGEGGVLANAFFPDDVNPEPYAGDVQFDLGESWEVGNGRGEEAYDILYVAVHEVGHALGLEHSDVADSVMNSLVEPGYQFRDLHAADIIAINELYGHRSGKPGPSDHIDRDLPGPGRIPGLISPFAPGFDTQPGPDGLPMNDQQNGSDSEGDTNPPQRRFYSHPMDEWASDLNNRRDSERSSIFESSHRVVTLDVDVSLEPADLGADLTSPIDDILRTQRDQRRI